MKTASEFSIIQQYFSALPISRADVVLGIGDDCALLANPAQQLMAISIDTLVEGVHFFADVDPQRLGHKALAVNLSDLAAMGAQPAWFTLALSLPELDELWLSAFSAGMAQLAKQHQIQLVGGDTTRGPLSITVQVHGHVSADKALKRAAAQPGDSIYVTGTLGDAAAALQYKLGNLTEDALTESALRLLIDRLELPTPRNEIGQQLGGLAHAAIDISDGLLADLGHILTASQVGAVLDLTQLPLSSVLQTLPIEQAQHFALSGGDDYELCFTAIPEQIAPLLERYAGQIHRIGEITAEPGIFYCTNTGDRMPLTPLRKGYEHFN